MQRNKNKIENRSCDRKKLQAERQWSNMYKNNTLGNLYLAKIFFINKTKERLFFTYT